MVLHFFSDWLHFWPILPIFGTFLCCFSIETFSEVYVPYFHGNKLEKNIRTWWKKMVNELIAFQPAILSKYWYRVENVPFSINSSKLSFSPNQSPFFRTIISCWKMWASILHNIFGSSESQINFSWCNDGNSRFRALLHITVNSNIWAYFRRATTNQRRTYIYI